MEERIKIKFDDPEFFVNEENKTVTCKLRGFINMPEGTYRVWEDIVNTIATAECSPEDEFNIEKGKRISLAKAESKIFKRARKSLLLLKNDLEYTRDLISGYQINSQSYIDHNEDYIKTISNGTMKVNPLKRGTVRFVEKKKKIDNE